MQGKLGGAEEAVVIVSEALARTGTCPPLTPLKPVPATFAFALTLIAEFL
jgi:hypothetical protein